MNTKGPHNVDPTWLREWMLLLWISLLVFPWAIPLAGLLDRPSWTWQAAVGVGLLIVCLSGGMILLLRRTWDRAARTDREPASWPVVFLRVIRDLLAAWGFIQLTMGAPF